MAYSLYLTQKKVIVINAILAVKMGCFCLVNWQILLFSVLVSNTGKKP